MKTRRKFVALFLIMALLGSTLACSLTSLVQSEPNTEQQPSIEQPQEPPPEEFAPQEPPPEEQPMEEPPPEDPPAEEPPQQQPPAQQPPAQQPQPQQPSGGAWTTDVAVTDIYPGNQPHGQFNIRITNNGPGTMNAVQMAVSCSSERTDKKTGKLSSGGNVNLNLTISIKPGETQIFPTGLTLDTTTFDYLVGCEAHPGFNDPNPANNVYNETFK